MNKITAFSVVNPRFVGNDLEKLNGIGQLVKQNNLSGANQLLSSLEAKYAAARFLKFTLSRVLSGMLSRVRPYACKLFEGLTTR